MHHVMFIHYYLFGVEFFLWGDMVTSIEGSFAAVEEVAIGVTATGDLGLRTAGSTVPFCLCCLT